MMACRTLWLCDSPCSALCSVCLVSHGRRTRSRVFGARCHFRQCRQSRLPLCDWCGPRATASHEQPGRRRRRGRGRGRRGGRREERGGHSYHFCSQGGLQRCVVLQEPAVPAVGGQWKSRPRRREGLGGRAHPAADWPPGALSCSVLPRSVLCLASVCLSSVFLSSVCLSSVHATPPWLFCPLLSSHPVLCHILHVTYTWWESRSLTLCNVTVCACTHSSHHLDRSPWSPGSHRIASHGIALYRLLCSVLPSAAAASRARRPGACSGRPPDDTQVPVWGANQSHPTALHYHCCCCCCCNYWIGRGKLCSIGQFHLAFWSTSPRSCMSHACEGITTLAPTDYLSLPHAYNIRHIHTMWYYAQPAQLACHRSPPAVCHPPRTDAYTGWLIDYVRIHAYATLCCAGYTCRLLLTTCYISCCLSYRLLLNETFISTLMSGAEWCCVLVLVWYL